MANNPKPLAGKVVDTLLDKLGSDDSFRDLFQKNPAEALRQVGAPEPEDCARCLKISKLADKKTIKAAGNELKTHLSGTLSLQVPQLIAR